MSNYLKKTKRAWEENEYDALRRQPLQQSEVDNIPLQLEPMFDGVNLRMAYAYYKRKLPNMASINEDFMTFLLYLEKDVPFDQQKRQP